MPLPPRWLTWNWRYGRRLRWGGAAVLLVAALATAGGPESAPARTTVTVAARDIASGAVLEVDDVTTAQWEVALDSPPPDAVVGSVARGPLAGGEPVTRTRLVPGGLVSPPPGTVVYPLTLADERIAALLNSGDRVDVLVTPDTLHDGTPRTVATDVEVLGVPDPDTSSFAGGESGAVVLLAVPEGDAPTELAGIRRSDHVSVAIR